MTDLTPAQHAALQEWQDEQDRLRRAAPELLEACEAVLGQLDYLRNLWGDEGITRRLADQIRQAVARAKGE